MSKLTKARWELREMDALATGDPPVPRTHCRGRGRGYHSPGQGAAGSKPDGAAVLFAEEIAATGSVRCRSAMSPIFRKVVLAVGRYHLFVSSADFVGKTNLSKILFQICLQILSKCSRQII